FTDLKFLTAISPGTIAKIVIETYEKIITNLKEYIKLPETNSDLYLNYKNTHSIVLMAVVNAKYEFLMVDVGAHGRAEDAEPECLPNSTVKAPFVFVGDSAFALNENLLKPYSFSTLDPQEITFNNRVS
ncbi:hypothetical protein CVS40_5130, partial [Lucilia cuprina]